MAQGLTRLPDWRLRFAAEMDRQRRAAFEWGAHDCASGLAFGAVEAITGVDMRADWGGYTTPMGVLKMLRKRGFEDMGEAMAATFPEIHPVTAHVGDLGLIPTDGEIGFGLCVFDAGSLIVLTETGHGRAPRSDAVRAFKVG